MENENTSPCDTKQQCLEVSCSELPPAAASPSAFKFFNDFLNSFNITSLNCFSYFFIQTLFDSGDAAIGSKVREASVATNDFDLLEVEPSTHGISGVTPGGYFFLSSFSIISFDNFFFDSYISIISDNRFLGNFFNIGTASANRSGTTTCFASHHFPPCLSCDISPATS